MRNWLQRAWDRTKVMVGNITPRIVWDATMVYLAFINLFLIGFDFTYLWLRSFYVERVPAVVRVYDPVKGIEPEPLISAYLEAVNAIGAATSPEERERALAEVRGLSDGAAAYEPLVRSGQLRERALFDSRLRLYVGEMTGREPAALNSAQALQRLWRPASEEELAATLDLFNRELRPILAVTYRRAVDRTGDYVDYGWLVDLPFLVLFTIEFYTRWILAVRRRRYPKWFIFPIVHWYDFLGIVPLPQFRIFRLFRIASIYVRLHRSSRSRVGDDVVSRTVKYFTNIISEEISDMVSLRILNETQHEISAGTHRRIVRTVLTARREAIAREVAERVRRVLTAPDFRVQARRFLDANLDGAMDASESLRRLPLPAVVVEPLVGAVGRIVFDATIETLADTVGSEEGRQMVEEIIADAVDGLVDELTDGEVEELVREIALESIEHVKEAVSVRKWAEPES